MLKAIAKFICPSSKSIADKAAERIQIGYNGVSDEKRAVVSKYANIANEIGQYGQNLANMLTDGTIDNLEREKIAVALECLVEKAKVLVFD